ncbi:hypothetical protein OAL35_02180 [bacterium]|nr:hypothetical protein [bacterium]
MTISSCPRCGESYQLPSTAIPDDSIAECPWCLEQFSLEEARGGAPPDLRIISAKGLVSAPGEPVSQTLEDAGIAPTFGFHSLEQRFENSSPIGDRDDDAAANQSEDSACDDPLTLVSDPVVQPWDESPSTPTTSLDFPQAKERPKRKSSGIGTMIGVVVGGLASLPLAGLILLAMGKAPDLGFWPFQGNEPSRRSAAPLRSSESRGGARKSRGTPLRFNQPIDLTKDNTDPATDAFKAINESVDASQRAINKDTADEDTEETTTTPESDEPTEDGADSNSPTNEDEIENDLQQVEPTSPDESNDETTD